LYEKSIKTIRSAASLSNVLKNEIIDEVFYCKSIIVEDEVQHIIHACEEVGVAFRLHSQLLTMSSSKIELKHFDGRSPLLPIKILLQPICAQLEIHY
jgi:hypothetical protein